MVATVTPYGGRYRCDYDYDNGQSDHLCTILDARILDEPLTDLILHRCRFVEYAEAVLTQVEAAYTSSREDARHRKRELAHPQEEVETLKHNPALTRTPDQVAIIFEQIHQRMQRMTALADEPHSPVGRVLSAAQMVTLKAFMADIRMGWGQQPAELRNELFRLLLERVVLESTADHVNATVVWRAGLQQRLWIERPRIKRGGKPPWTDDENACLKQHYATATRETLQARLPTRSYKTIRRHALKPGLNRPKPGRSQARGTLWHEEEKAVLRAYATGEISHADLLARSPGRSWDGIEKQARSLCLRFRQRQIYYRIFNDARDKVSLANHSVPVAALRSAHRSEFE